jgi:ribosome-binding ATPase
MILIDGIFLSVSIGIVGLPNVGKSTLFNALTKGEVLAANYPFATIDPNVGIVDLPDERLEILSEMYSGAKIIPATVKFVDIAGIVAGASEGQGLGNKFLANIRECDVIVQVVRAFNDDDVIHVDGKVSPADDIQTIQTELILADISSIQTKIKKIDPKLKKLAEDALAKLDEGILLSASGIDSSPLELQLLTAKPFIYVFNIDEEDIGNANLEKNLQDLVSPFDSICLCAKIEDELKTLDQKDANELLAELGQGSSGLDRLAKVGFATLGLQTYLTAGPKEVRAWTIKQGSTAPEAAGVIHTDFQKGFIKAEIVSFSDLVIAKSLVSARALGKARLEGKDYTMRDGDVVEFRFNV